jgi:hypothetical protein
MRKHGEGDHPKGGGGVTGGSLRNYPSTRLRLVPLPILDGEDIRQLFSLYPVLKIQATTARQTSRKPSVAARLIPTATSPTP